MTVVEHCTRCGREAPSATWRPGGASEQVAEGWVTFERDDGSFEALVCPGCLTEEDRHEMWPDDQIRREMGLDS
jgi:hypothetical protein